MKLVSSEQMRSIDRRAIEEHGISGICLMENAGRCVLEAMERFLPGLAGRSFGVVCGRGNNGGDGLVVARLLHGRELSVVCVVLAVPESLEGDSATSLRRAENAGLKVAFAPDSAAFAPLKWQLADCRVIIDAILGTGLSREVRGLAREVIDFLGGLDSTLISVDIPSGLSADTGRARGAALRAALTVTFGCPKVGQVVYPGAGMVGTLEVADIGIPPAAVEAEGARGHLLDAQAARALLKPRPATGHKGTFGHVLIVGGAKGKTGAAALCSQAAARSGVGLVTLAVPEALNPILEVKLTEAMTEPLPDSPQEALEVLNRLIGRSKAVALGPGWDTAPGSAEVVRGLVRDCPLPMVIDAGGLSCLAEDLAVLDAAAAPRVITPHPGEMGRLCRCSSADVQADRTAHARAFAAEHHAVVVLKGARTVVAVPDGRYWINPTGSVAMAPGGMGDVLTGLLGGLLAQGYGPLEAALLATHWHGLAGEMAAERLAEVGVLASDVIETLPAAWRRLARAAPGYPAPLEQHIDT
ncbi:MAG: NAD(P)H-hydrate dehydratase [Pseudomonadota bacterium]